MNYKTKFYSQAKKNFSKLTSEKERRLNQFFKLPKTKLEFPDQVFDRPDEEYSVMKSYNEDDIDKMDMMEKVIKKKKLESERQFNRFFSNNSTFETLKITENLVEKMRMNKEFKFTQDFKEKEILNEYGNYDKYFENYKVTKEREYDSNDDGESNWAMKYEELQEKYKNPETKGEINDKNKSAEERINADLEQYGSDFSFNDYLAAKRRDEQFGQGNGSTNPRTSEDYLRDEVKKARKDITPRPRPEEPKMDIRTKREKDIGNKHKLAKKTVKDIERMGFRGNTLESEENDFKPKITGRVSPWCKEDIYRSYLEGWTVKDLSYKYGLLPERVKVIIFMRDFFWKNIYPKIGESGLRRRMEMGMEYAKKFAYIDYGKDLQLMASREQGVRLKKVFRSEIDAKPTKEIEEKISEAMKKIKPRATDFIPLKFFGKGASGYLIKDMVRRRGYGSKRVSFMFQKYCYYKDLHPQILPQKVLDKKELGPRLATLGYRF